jgi:HK97 family phage major capsid protein
MLTQKAIYEIVELQDKALVLSRSAKPAERAESSALLSRIALIRETGEATSEVRQKYCAELNNVVKESPVSPEAYKRAFEYFVKNGDSDHSTPEYRDLVAGQQSIVSVTQGVAGGYLVPVTTELEVLYAMKNIDPLLDSAVCDFKISDTPTFRPTVLAGYDLSSISASLIGEAVQQGVGQFPNVLAKTLRSSLIYKSSLSATLEALDDIPAATSKFAEIFGTALARQISQDCTTGNGTSQPQGILTAIPTRAYTTLNSGKIVLNDINSIFFSVDRFWRNRPKTGWIFSDSVYQRIRAATDTSGRPLINVQDGTETLLGRPLYISPSLPAVGGSIGLNSVIIFGSLDQFHIRMSKIVMAKSINSTTTDITTGRALFTARAKVDSVLTDFSLGANPGIVVATVIA